MRIRLIRRQRRTLITGILLATLLWRAMIPSGFMPAAGGSLALAICPEGMPGMTMMGHDADHLHGHTRNEHCPFGAAPFAAPVPCVVVTAMLAGELAPAAAQRYNSLRAAVRGARAHLPRGPPV